jgi:hypothetical protein
VELNLMNIVIIRKVMWIVLLGLFFQGCGQQPEDVSEPEVAVKSLRMGTFNMLRFGHGEKKIDRLASLVLKSKYQIFSAIEVMDREAAVELRERLRDMSGKNWELSISKYANGETTYKEYFAFFYRADLIKPVTSAEGVCATSFVEAQTDNGCFVKDNRSGGQSDFDRDPYIAQFRVGQKQFAVAAVHLVFGGSDSESMARRQSELKNLKKVMKNMRAGAQGYNILASGDFNLAIPEKYTTKTSAGKMPKDFFSAAPSITGLVTGPTTIGQSNYDHFLYLNDNEVKHVPGSESTTLDFDMNDDAAKELFKREVSDHFPTGVSFSL